MLRYCKAIVCLLMALLFTVQASTAYAATINVPADDTAALISAIETANATPGTMDTIVLGGGTYTLTSAYDDTNGATGLPAITSPITLDGNDAVIMRESVDDFRIMYVGADGFIEMSNITFAGGRGPNGAGVYVVGGIANFFNVAFEGNETTTLGGASALKAEASSISLVNNTFQNNSVGGGYTISLTSLDMDDSITVDGNTITDNLGTAFHATGLCDKPIAIVNNTITRNRQNVSDGIGVEVSFDDGPGCDFSISDNTIVGNEGGGIEVFGPGGTIANNAIQWNTSAQPEGGGGIQIYDYVWSLSNNTISYNAAEAGGALSVTEALGASVTLSENLIYANEAGLSSGIYADADVTASDSCFNLNGVGYANATNTTQLAENNWWGDAGGPGVGSADTITGLVDTDPYLTSQPAHCDTKLSNQGTPTAPTNLQVNWNNGAQGFDLTWNPTPGVTDGTLVLREAHPEGGSVTVYNGTDGTVTDATVECGRYYRYTLRTLSPEGDSIVIESELVQADCNVFEDVPGANQPAFFQEWIEDFYGAGITEGCATDPLRFCPETPVNRAQMAVFILRAINYPNLPYSPTGIDPNPFEDVPSPNQPPVFENWIEDFLSLGITQGCNPGGTRFCPETNVDRGQMAVFILRALEGPGYMPVNDPDDPFVDVPGPNQPPGWEAWIEDFYNRGITTGCNNGVEGETLEFCPEVTVDRGQMAVFILRAFDAIPDPNDP